MTREVDVDYLVVGGGATGMAFTDALIDHSDATVALVDRRHGVGGHWLAAYPFVRLHQASSFYGVASTVLGGGRVQRQGPEAGLFERAGQPAIAAYYAEVLADRMVGSGRVEMFSACEYLGRRSFVSRVSGERFEVPTRTRIVDARYLAPDIPAERPPRFLVDDDARVVAVNDVVGLDDAPSQYVVIGSGKTATDAVVWLLGHGVDPGAICWVRPRDPWMLNRALVQPDARVYLDMVADTMAAAATAASLPELFVSLEDAGIMLRIDRSVTPTMAKAPTLGTWELDLLRTVEDVVRLGHVRRVSRGRIELDEGGVTVADDAVVIDCAADGLKNPPLVPIWRPEAITVQPVRAGFPCFGAALVGYLEATRQHDATKNALAPPSRYGNSLDDWARMQLAGSRATAAFGAEPDVAQWADGVALNPARTPSGYDAERLRVSSRAGLARLAELVEGSDSLAP